MASINLLRNTKLFATTNLDTVTRNIRSGNEYWTYTKPVTAASYNAGTITYTVPSGHGLPTDGGGTLVNGRIRVKIEGTTADYNVSGAIVTGVINTTQFTVAKTIAGSPAAFSGSGTFTTTYYYTNLNSKELLLGAEAFKFSRSTNVETISPNESGSEPLRGERQFNQSVNPVEFSFTTYIRPYRTGTAPAGVVNADEGILWNALMGAASMNETRVDLGIGAVDQFTVNQSGVLTLSLDSNLTAPTLVAGKVYGVKGIGSYGLTSATGDATKLAAIIKEWNAPVRLTSQTANTYTFQYLTQPSISGSIHATDLNALNIDLNSGAWTVGGDVTYCHGGAQDVLQLAPFGLIAVMDDLTYLFDDCVIDNAQVNFAMDQVAQVTWTGKAKNVRQLAAETLSEGQTDTTFGGSLYGYVSRANKAAGYITNRLSTVLLKNNIGGADDTTGYYAPITGGQITISNNIQTVTPNTIYEVNTPVAFFVGNRTITGNFSVYLRSGTRPDLKKQTSDLMATLLGSGNNGVPLVDPKFYLELQVGGSTAATKVHFDMQAVTLQIPEINTDQILSLNVNFRAQGSNPVFTSNADYDISNANELFIRYYA